MRRSSAVVMVQRRDHEPTVRPAAVSEREAGVGIVLEDACAAAVRRRAGGDGRAGPEQQDAKRTRRRRGLLRTARHHTHLALLSHYHRSPLHANRCHLRVQPPPPLPPSSANPLHSSSCGYMSVLPSSPRNKTPTQQHTAAWLLTDRRK